MKALLLTAFLLTASIQAQTSMSHSDIAAQAGNRYETLLTNVESLSTANVDVYLQKIGMTYSDNKHWDNSGAPANYTARFEKKIISGEEKQGYVWVKWTGREVDGYMFPINDKVEIWGDPIMVVRFFCGFWSNALDFEDVKPGEVVTTRFLTDVATLTFPDANTAKITVVPAKDRKKIN